MSNSSNIDNCSSSALPKNFNVYHHDAHSEAHEVNHSSLKSKFTGRDTGGSILLSFVRVSCVFLWLTKYLFVPIQ
jgi:hypothetical protein